MWNAKSASGNPCLCIVVTCYRQSGLLPEAICSALLQEPACNLILVNDGCPYEETHLFCAAVRAAYPNRVLYLHQTNGGPASARNAGIEVALRAWPRLEAVFLLDGDNRLGKMTIRRMHDAMTDSNADWIFSDLEVIGNRGILGMAGEYSVLEHVFANYVDTGSLIARRVLENGIRFDATFIPGLEDWEFWLHAATHKFRGRYVPASGFLYRSRPESLVHDAADARHGVIGHLRRRHGSLINPRHWVRMEHEEAPRFALLLGAGRVALFTDPAERGRSMAQKEFLDRLAWFGAAGELARVPPYLIVMSPEFVARLEKGRLLHGLFWRLEAVASTCQSPVALAYADGNSEDKLGCYSEDKGCLPIIVCRTDVALYSQEEPLPSRVRVAGFALPAVDASQVIGEFRITIRQLRALVKSQTCADMFQINSRSRRKTPITHDVQSLFHASPLYPLADARRRIGFLIKGEITGPALNHLSLLVFDARALGASTHLFWIVWESMIMSPVKPLFDTIAFISPKELGNLDSEPTRSEALGALCMMDVVVNHECPEWLLVSGKLKRLGTDTVFSACQSGDSASSRAMLDAGLQFEYSVNAYVADCPSLRSRWNSLGIPSAKLPANLGDWLTRPRNDYELPSV